MYINTVIRIKNAEAAQKTALKIPFSKMDADVLETLKEYGFLKSIEVKGRSYKKVIEIFVNPDRLIQGVKWLSKPSVRRYGTYKDFYRVKNGYGILVVSTPKGVMSGVKARREKVGGQLLFEIW